jgi:hypothetical protein
MENELNKDEMVFFDLLESTDFEELNERELILVGKFCSEEEYKLQRKIVVTAGEEQDTVLAAPLVLPAQKAAIVIPLYQTILAVASVIIFFILIWPSQEQNKPVTIQAKDNDNSQPTIEVIHDTIVKYVSVVQPAVNYVHDTIYEVITRVEFKSLDNRLLEASSDKFAPPMSKESIETKGKSLKEDGISKLITANFSEFN